LSLVALNNGGNSPQEMLSMSEDRRYEVRQNRPAKVNQHYFDDQKESYHQQLDHIDSSNDPYSETRGYESYKKHQGGSPLISDQNHFYQKHNQQTPDLF